jgi:unsaturated chondroitin disaccharide hydrolase
VTDLTALLPRLEAVFDFARPQLRRLITTHPDTFPMYTTNGKWSVGGERWTNWCEGFLGGQLWLIAAHTADPTEAAWFRDQAEHYSRLVEHRKTDLDVHDLGFVFMSTWKRWYDLTGEPGLNAVLIEAGTTLAKRFQSKGRYLRSFLAQDSLFIDIMMNVGIIFYAARETSDPALWQIARQHCDTTRRFLVRGDGSTLHEGIFSLETGEFLRPSTQQGYRQDSCWARGLAWALYGFGTIYGYTKDARDLATAEAIAAYYLAHLPEHGVPPNDFDEPDRPLPYESSAAAIAAGGLWRLARLTTDATRAYAYRQAALRTLDTLTSPEFLANETPGWEGLLKHGIYHIEKGLGVDESVMWGEYFFLETVAEVLDDARHRA